MQAMAVLPNRGTSANIHIVFILHITPQPVRMNLLAYARMSQESFC